MSNFNSLQANYEDIYPNQFLDSISALVIEGNILITGAKGMLGNAFAYAMQELQSKGFLNESKIILSSRHWSSKETLYWQNFGNIETVTNKDLLNNYQSIDYVIHTASPSNITKINSIADLRNPNTKLLKNIFRLSPKKINSFTHLLCSPCVIFPELKHVTALTKPSLFPRSQLY